MKRSKILGLAAAVSVAAVLAGCGGEGQIYESRTDWLKAEVYTNPSYEFIGKSSVESIPYERGLKLFRDGKNTAFVDIDGIVYLPAEGQAADVCGGLVVGVCHESLRIFNEDRILVGRCTIDDIDREADYAAAFISCGPQL